MTLRAEKQREIVRRLLALHADKSTELAPEPLHNPASDYTSGAQFEVERHKLFRERPVVACLSVDVAAPGSYLATDSGGIPFVVVRGDDGELRAFVNICRHRATMLLTGCGQLSRSIVCGFHGWTYGLDGRLVAQPFACDGFASIDRAELSLHPVAVAESCGLVFVRPASNEPIDTAALLCGLDDELPDFAFDTYHRFDTWVSRWRCNYKLILDTFLEAYHVFALHKATVARYFISAPSTFAPFGPNLRYHSLQKNFPELAQLPEDQWDLSSRSTIEYFIAPNTILSHSVDHLALYRFLPQGVDDTISEMTIYTPAPVATDEQRAHYERTLELHQKVSGGEDFILQENIQRSLASGMVQETIFGRNEPAAIHFHEQLRRLIAETP
jgi:phenylpropionate dioxygenase-like ring-hydroxylating dioxygenase large terminal subunit